MSGRLTCADAETANRYYRRSLEFFPPFRLSPAGSQAPSSLFDFHECILDDDWEVVGDDGGVVVSGQEKKFGLSSTVIVRCC